MSGSTAGTTLINWFRRRQAEYVCRSPGDPTYVLVEKLNKGQHPFSFFVSFIFTIERMTSLGHDNGV